MDSINNIISKLPKRDIFYLTLIIIISVFLIRGCEAEHKLSEEITTYSNIHNAINGEIITYKTKDSLWASKFGSVSGEYQSVKREYETKFKFQNAELDRLMALVNKKTQAGIVMNSKTEIASSVKTIIQVDTVYNNNIIEVKQVYIVKDTNQWLSLNVYVSKDSSDYDVTLRNAYDIKIEKEKWNAFKPFKKQEIFAHVVNLNPYTQTTALQSYIPVKQKKKYRGLKYGAIFLAGFIVAKNI